MRRRRKRRKRKRRQRRRRKRRRKRNKQQKQKTITCVGNYFYSRHLSLACPEFNVVTWH